MTTKLRLAVMKRRQQELTAADISAIVRQQLKTGIEPERWNDGFFNMPEEELPDIFFFQSGPRGLRPTVWWDYAFTGKKG